MLLGIVLVAMLSFVEKITTTNYENQFPYTAFYCGSHHFL